MLRSTRDRFFNLSSASTANKILYKIMQLKNVVRSENHDQLVKVLSKALDKAINYSFYQSSEFTGENEEEFRRLVAIKLIEMAGSDLFKSPIFINPDKLAQLIVESNYKKFPSLFKIKPNDKYVEIVLKEIEKCFLEFIKCDPEKYGAFNINDFSPLKKLIPEVLNLEKFLSLSSEERHNFLAELASNIVFPINRCYVFYRALPEEDLKDFLIRALCRAGGGDSYIWVASAYKKGREEIEDRLQVCPVFNSILPGPVKGIDYDYLTPTISKLIVKYDNVTFYKIPNSQSLTFDNVPTSHSIQSLKEQIQDKTGVPPEGIRLIYAGKQVVNQKTLEDYAVPPDEAQFYLVLR